MFCAFEIIQLFSVLFCMVRAVHKFDFRLVKEEHLTNGDQCKESHSVAGIIF